MDDEGLAESTQTLLLQVEAGDQDAESRLFARYLPALHRWARGRLPRWARDITDTRDLVQDAMFQTFKNLKTFENRGQGALHAYLRQAVLNGIREQLRHHQRRPAVTQIDSGIVDPATSPLEHAVGVETSERYERALQSLEVDEREAVIARVELGLSYKEIAEALGKPSADAARMAVARALARLAQGMDRD